MAHRPWFVAIVLACGFVAAIRADDSRLSYPPTARIDHVDNYHGVEVADPYRWLEEDVRKSKDVAAWVAAENEVTFAYLKTIPERESIRKRLTELWNYERYTAPHKVAGKYYFSKN